MAKLDRDSLIEVHYIVRIPAEDLNRLLNSAEEDGYSYSDAGKLETLRRKLIGDGINSLEETIPGLILKYERKV